MARFAEERFQMNDLSGAVQLIDEALELDASFISFYRQRAKYFFLLGKQEQAILDLHVFFKTNPQNFTNVENQLRHEKFYEYSSRKSEFETLIHDMYKKAETKAITSYEHFLRRWEKLVEQYGKFAANTVNVLNHHSQLAKKKLENTDYANLVEFAENCEIMREIVDVLETESKCKKEFETLKLRIQSNQLILAKIEDNERKRLIAFQSREEDMARTRKLWGLILAPLASLGTFAIFGILTYGIFLLVYQLIKSGDQFYVIFLSFIGMISVILAFISAIYVFRSTWEALKDRVGQPGNTYEEMSHELQKLRLQRSQDNDMYKYLNGKLNELPLKRSKLENSIIWKF